MRTGEGERQQAGGRGSGRAGAAPIGGVVAAMAFTAAVASTWVAQPVTRTVGDVAVTETRTTAGMELAPVALILGMVAVVFGLGSLATHGMARQIAAMILAVTGGGAVVAVVVAISRAVAMDGRLTAAPWIAAPAAVAVAAAGVFGRGRTGRRMPKRYDVDADPGDREWQLATDPGEGERQRAGGRGSQGEGER
jgi:hypothetical protein